MGILLQLVTCVVCTHVVLSQPIRDDGGSIYGHLRTRMDKRNSFHPFRESLLTSFGLLEHSRGSLQSQRKKAVDSTFIRFGRSSTPSVPHRTTPREESSEQQQQRLVVDHNGCRISSSQELLQALMNDPNCARAFPKVKREHVHDTFIRFGKRSVPSGETGDISDSSSSSEEA